MTYKERLARSSEIAQDIRIIRMRIDDSRNFEDINALQKLIKLLKQESRSLEIKRYDKRR